ncbi:MAG: ATP-binding protein [Candidatus Sumerlaeota bacterium]|nr:ATP-binding protein [Candidatus Sumerlaeota bacterium]
MIQRDIQVQVEGCLFKGKAIVVYGARQVGKTTLIRQTQEKFLQDSIYLNCDETDIRESLTDITSTHWREIIGSKKIIFLDEAQRVLNIGLTLKLFVDNFPDRQIVATGSSSLDLSNRISEPLTGRKFSFHLHPFSLRELGQGSSALEIGRLLESRMIFGMYPEIALKPDMAATQLREIVSSYLYKDVLQYQDIRRPELLERLLIALALQIGSEVSYNELANSLGISKQTVANYIDLLEKAFVIFRLGPFSRNLRNELSKMRKIYFVDTGIRNALIRNFNALDVRADVGALWENFMICERLKRNANSGHEPNAYFWRTHQQQEIDYLEEEGGRLEGFEFTWREENRKRLPKIFTETYPQSTISVIHRGNFGGFAGL